MSNKKQQIPAIRFNGFTDAWEQRKLGEVADYYDGTHQTPAYTNHGVKFISVENIRNIHDSNKYISKQDYEKQFKIKPQINDIFMTRITAGIIGDTALLEQDAPLAYYVSLALIRSKFVNPLFLEKYIGSPFFKKELHKRIIHTAFPKKINLGEIGECGVIIPNSLTEQIKVGLLFKKLDDTIALHQRQLHNYKQLKKAMMQKIFNQELRFKDQDGNNYPEWKTTNLDKICTIKTGNMNVQDSVSDGKYTFFDRSETIKKLNEYSYDEEALIYPGEGSSFYPRYFKGKYALHQRAYSLSDFEEDCSARYVYHYLNTKNNHFLKTCVGTTVRSLRMTSFESCEVEIPSYLEQQEIADFLSAIEKRLENLEQTVELLKEQKKGLMQQMFV